MVFFTWNRVALHLRFVSIEFFDIPVGKPSWSLAVAGSAIRIFRTINLRQFVQESIAMINSVPKNSWLVNENSVLLHSQEMINVEVSA